MSDECKIGIEVFKSVTKSIAHSDSLDAMSGRLSQLLVTSMALKGCAIFVLNPETQELEILASFGLSVKYLTKGPLKAPQSIHDTFQGKTVVIADVQETGQLQYPEEAVEEGIRAMVSLPILFRSEVIGVLRLYHQRVWRPSEADLDSLRVLADAIGLAMTYIRLANGVQAIGEILEQVQPGRAAVPA